MPNELTPARRGPALCQGVSSVLTLKGVLGKSMAGSGTSQFRLGGSSLCCKARLALINPATPAAASR